jgi:hypothetical protein
MEDDYVEGLTGEEIIVDVLEQVAERLRADCNLRDTDAYAGGYDGWVEVHLNLRGLDLAKVDSKVIVGAPASVLATGAKEDAPEVEQKTVDAMVEIPLETKLNVVRERSGQDVPTLSKDEDGRPVIKKRHYAKTKVNA